MASSVDALELSDLQGTIYDEWPTRGDQAVTTNAARMYVTGSDPDYAHCGYVYSRCAKPTSHVDHQVDPLWAEI